MRTDRHDETVRHFSRLCESPLAVTDLQLHIIIIIIINIGAFAKFRKATISFVMSVSLSTIPTGRILIRFDILVFFENLSRKFKFD